ncbi:MAG: STAS domain-containing protein [Methylacidiphilales bacterium]|nr:STAS domain-containing protein [Candidatus Methylacidiphilales bacterium]MDW8349436.1 STAS domain-containing protein [Verrucomicrobiae bacterium]
MPDQISAAIDPPYIYIRISGRATFQNAPLIKAFLDSTINASQPHVILDLQTCTYLDSTFLGTLTGIALRHKKQGLPPLHFIHTTGRNLEIITNLCLDKLFTIHSTSPFPDPTPLSLKSIEPITPLDKNQTSASMLQAHENLIQWHPPNASKFQDVVHYLRSRNTHTPNP